MQSLQLKKHRDNILGDLLMSDIFVWIISNVFTWSAGVAVLFGLILKPVNMNRYANILRFLFLWYAGIAFLCSGFFHLFLSKLTATAIGWMPSPFQFEVGLANWSIAIFGFMAFFKKNNYFWLSGILAIIIFSVGAGAGHVYQLVENHNHASSNSGLILYTDIFVPFLMLFLWFKGCRARVTENKF